MPAPIITGFTVVPIPGRPNAVRYNATIDPNGGGATTVRVRVRRPNNDTCAMVGGSNPNQYTFGPYTVTTPVTYDLGNLILDTYNPGFDPPWQFYIDATNTAGTTTTPLVTVNLAGPAVAPGVASDTGGGVYTVANVSPPPNNFTSTRCCNIISSSQQVDAGAADTFYDIEIGPTPALGATLQSFNFGASGTFFGALGTCPVLDPSVVSANRTWGLGGSVQRCISDFTLAGIPQGSTYYLRGTLRNSVATNPPSTVVGPFTAPIDDSSASAPSIGTITSTTIDVSYAYDAQGTSAGGPWQQTYVLQRSIGGVGGPWTDIDTTSPTGTGTRTFTDTGLTPGTQYCYRVRLVSCQGVAFDRYYGGGVASCATTPIPCPSTVTNLAVTGITQTGATLAASVGNLYGRTANITWEYGTSPGFGQSAGSQSITGAGAGVVSATTTLTGLIAGTTYYYRACVTTPGCGAAVCSATSTFTTTSIPPCLTPIVTALPATLVTTNTATFNGTVNNQNEAGSQYQFEFKLASNPSWAGASTTGLVSLPPSFANQPVVGAVGSLTPGTTYDVRLCSTVACGGVACSTPIQFTTAALPPPVPTATTTNGGCPGATQSTLDVSGTVNPNGSATTVLFQYDDNPAFTSPSSTAPVAIGSGVAPVNVTATITGLNAGTTYYFRVSATNGSGTSVGAIYSCTTDPAPPPAPAIGSVTASCGTSQTTIPLSVTITPNGLATSFIVQYGTTPGLGSSTAPTAIGAAITPVVTPITLTGLTPDTDYYYRISATNASGTNVSVIFGPCRTQATPPPPPAPQIVSVTADPCVLATSTTLTFEALIDDQGAATTVDFDWGVTPAYGLGPSAPTVVGPGGGPHLVSFVATGLVPGTVYHWRVRAVSTNGAVTSLDQVCETLAAPTPPDAVTLPATLISDDGATLNGLVDLGGCAGPASYRFEYGTTIGLGSVTPNTPITLISPQYVSFPLTGLSPGGTYFFRVCLTCDTDTVCGAINQFTTATAADVDGECDEVSLVELCHSQAVVLACTTDGRVIKIHTIYNADGRPIPAGTVDYEGRRIGTWYTDLDDNELNPGTFTIDPTCGGNVRHERDSMCVTYDDGVNPPVAWDVDRVVAWTGVEPTSVRFFDMAPMLPVDVTAFVTGVRHMGKCDCCNDGEFLLGPLHQSYSWGALYGAAGFGGNSKFDATPVGCGPISWTITVYHQNSGNNPIASAGPSPALADRAAAIAWVNAQATNAYFKIGDLGPNIWGYTLPPQSAGEYLIVITETADPSCTVPVSYGFGNNAPNYPSFILSSGGPFADTQENGATLDWSTRNTFTWQQS